MLQNSNPLIDIPQAIQKGTSPFTCWYNPGVINGAFTSGSSGTNTLRSQPFIATGGIVDTIGFEVTVGGAAGAVGRIGIYRSTSDTNIMPNVLIVDSGEFDCTTAGVKSATVNVKLEPGTLYWLALTFGVNACTVRLTNTISCPQVMGDSSALGSTVRSGITVNRTYAALPNPYTAGSTFATGGVAPGWIHYAS